MSQAISERERMTESKPQIQDSERLSMDIEAIDMALSLTPNDVEKLELLRKRLETLVALQAMVYNKNIGFDSRQNTGRRKRSRK